MASKRKSNKKPDPNQINALSEPDVDEALVLGRTVLRPTVQAAVTLKTYEKSYGDLDLNGLIDELAEQTIASNKGDSGLTIYIVTLFGSATLTSSVAADTG